jgi:hypothetical protein
MVDTYIDPETGKAYEYGVESFLDVGNASAFFDRFGIERAPLAFSNVTTDYIDFNTGNSINFTMPPFKNQMAAMQKFLDVVKPWTDYLRPGYWDFPQPEDIPEDFLIPYGDFVTKYGLEDAVPMMFASTGLGVGNMTEVPTMFVLQSFGTHMAESVLGKMDSYAPAHGNQALYNAVAEDLGDDVLYSSTVIATFRTEFGVFLTVRNNETGQITLITARQLLIAIEPTKDNTAPLGLSWHEHELLSKFTYTREYTAIINNTALEPGMAYFNMPAASAPDNYLILPEASFTNIITYLGGDNLFKVIIVGDNNLDEAGARALLQKDFNTLLSAGEFATTADQRKVDYVTFAVHGPMHARVSVEDVKAGFYQDLYGLQGQRSTWWTGGAFSVNFQTTLWAFDETLFPKILANLE